MKLLKERREKFCHTETLDNFLKRGVKGSGIEAWIDKVEKPLDIENNVLLYQVRWSIHALGLKCAALNMTKKGKRINNR